MHSAEEWRQHKLHWLEDYRGKSFRFAKYSAPIDEWDHDHCEGCRAKFSESNNDPDSLSEGYVTAEPADNTPSPEPEYITKCKEQGAYCIPLPSVGSFYYYWVCPACFEEFREILEFRLEEESGPAR